MGHGILINGVLLSKGLYGMKAIRSLALGDFGLREGWMIANKRFLVGVISGVSIALLCAMTVFAWIQSYRLKLIT